MNNPVGTGTISLVGQVKFLTTRACTPIGLSQSIANVQAKVKEVTVPHDSVVTPVALDLPAGVTEALVLVISCAGPIVATITSSDGTSPGPINIGVQGVSIWTASPGEGFVSLSLTNKDTSNDALVQVGIGCLAVNTDMPTYWYPGT